MCRRSPLEALNSDLFDVTHGGGSWAGSLRADSFQKLSMISQIVWQCDRFDITQDMANGGVVKVIALLLLFHPRRACHCATRLLAKPPLTQ